MKPGTVSDRAIQATVELRPEDVAGDLGEAGGTPPTQADANRTIDSASFGSTPAGKPGTVSDNPYTQTIVSDSVPADLATFIGQTWAGVEESGANPNVTIKGQMQTRREDSTLSVQPRALRKANDRTTVNADYELIEKLGEGGMGYVYLARQASINRIVALKMLKADTAANQENRFKFLSEAVVTGDLDHPNIVPIYDLGTSQEGSLFYSMKRVQGTPWIDTLAQKSLPENIEILMKVADAVAFAHSRGVIHRDLKPENVMLGDFGEVLLLDWGLAVPTSGFAKTDSITQSCAMGGTPAYMAPEMATGPPDRVTTAADVYLLGAILYEIVTGRPPHAGSGVMQCLVAAAANQIQPTDKTGELIDIALWAMATQPADRPASVQKFQEAVRTYLSHTESIALAARAEEDLRHAQQSDNYQDYARSLFGFQEAHALWSGNSRAAGGQSGAGLAYATSALRKGDYDLATSLLDSSDPRHAPLLDQVRAAQRERDLRQQRLKHLRRAVRLGTALFLIVLTGASWWIWRERNKALAAGRVAQHQRRVALEQKQQADAAKEQEAAARQTAEDEKQKADAARDEAVEARGVAVTEREKAEAAKNDADRQRERAEYQAYVALIGLAAAKIDENAFGTARQLLEQCPPRLRHWEWNRLSYMCRLSVQDYAVGSPVETLALAPDGRFFTGGWNGLARLWDQQSGQLAGEFSAGDLNFVYAGAVSPDGKLAAVGTSDPQGYLVLWDTATGNVVRKLTGHTDAVVSLAFSRDGQRLLSGSFDRTAQLWDVSSGRSLRTLRGHRGWVWSVAFRHEGPAAPDTVPPVVPVETQAVTASQDGFAYVWQLGVAEGAANERSPAFRGHEGPVYAVAVAPDGQTVATAGYDKRVLIWRPAGLREFEYENVIFNETLPADRQAERRPLTAPQFLTLAGHTAAVRSLAFDRSGKRLVSGGHDNTVRVWDAVTGRLLKTLRGHDSWVRACLFAADDRAVLSAGYDQQVKRWDVESYEEVRRVPRGRVLEGHAGDILDAEFSRDGQYIVTAGRDRSARTWDVLSGKELMRFEEGHAFLASRTRYLADGKHLATAAVDNTVRIWSLATGTEIARIDQTGRQAALAVAPRGNWLLTGSAGNDAQLWELVATPQDDGQLRYRVEPRCRLSGHTAPVTALAFAPDGSMIFTGDAGGLGIVWDGGDPAQARELHKLRGHSARITEAVFLPGQDRLLTASGDGTVGQWTVARGEERRDLVLRHQQGASVTGLAVSPDGRLALTSCDDGQIRVWDVDRAAVTRFLTPKSTDGNVRGTAQSVSLSADGQFAASVSPEEQLVRLWDFATGEEICFPSGAASPKPFLDFQQRGLVWSASFSPDGSQLVTVGGDNARLWNISRTQPPDRESQVLIPHGSVACASFSPDGRYVVTGSWDNSARIWNARTGKAERKLEGHAGSVNSAVFSPDGRFVATGSSDGTAILWDAQSGKSLHAFRGHEDAVQSVAFSSDGKNILTASHDITARIWDVATHDVVCVLRGHSYGVLCARFSADARLVVTGGEDNTARVWDWRRGAQLVVLAGHTAAVSSVAFSPDGRRVLTGSDDFTAKLWDVSDVPTVDKSDAPSTAVPQAKEILTLKGHDQQVTSASFSSDGVLALTGSRDGTTVIWLAERPETAAQMAAGVVRP
jgi:WD40 repeat protein/serine/threonine protein kinase